MWRNYEIGRVWEEVLEGDGKRVLRMGRIVWRK